MSTTVQELVSHLNQEIGMPDVSKTGFALMSDWPGVEDCSLFYLLPTTKLCDIISMWYDSLEELNPVRLRQPRIINLSYRNRCVCVCVCVCVCNVCVCVFNGCVCVYMCVVCVSCVCVMCICNVCMCVYVCVWTCDCRLVNLLQVILVHYYLLPTLLTVETALP